MKKTWMLTACATLALFSFASCSNEEANSTIQDAGIVELTLKNQGIETITKSGNTKASLPHEDVINHVWVIATDGSGNVLSGNFGKQKFLSSEIINNKINYRTDINVSPQNFYVVGNISDAQVGSIRNANELKNIRLSASSMPTSPFILTSEKTNVNVQIPSPKIEATLERTVARIDVRLGTGVSNFELVNAELRNSKNETFLYPIGTTGSIIDYKTPIPASDSRSVVGKIYSFENFNSDKNNLGNSTCIIIGGYYNGDKSKMTYYRIDVLNTANEAKVDRGTAYTGTVTQILGRGWDTPDEAEANKAENLIYKINPWVEDASDVIFDGTTYFQMERAETQTETSFNLKLKSNTTQPITVVNNSPAQLSSININRVGSTEEYTAVIGVNANNSDTPQEATFTLKTGRLSMTHKVWIFKNGTGITLSRSIVEHNETAGAEIVTVNAPSGYSLSLENQSSFYTIGLSGNTITINYPDWKTLGASTIRTGAPVSVVATHSTGKKVSLPLSIVQFQRVYDISCATTTGTAPVSGTGRKIHGDNVTLSAPGHTGFSFVGFRNSAGATVSGNNPYSFTATQSEALTAVYNANKYTVTVTAGTGGKAFGGGDYYYGTTAKIEASPDNGFSFLQWSDGSTNPIREISITSNINLSASFKAGQVTIATSSTTGGKVSGGGNYNIGENVTLTATPDPNYRFIGWFENNSLVNNNSTYNFQASVNRSIEGRFESSIIKLEAVGTYVRTEHRLDAVYDIYTVVIKSPIPVSQNTDINITGSFTSIADSQPNFNTLRLNTTIKIGNTSSDISLPIEIPRDHTYQETSLTINPTKDSSTGKAFELYFHPDHI